MSFTDPTFKFVDLSKWEYYNTATYCVFTCFVAFLITYFINATVYQLFAKTIVPIMLLAACCDYLILLKTRNHYFSVIGFLFFLYILLFFGFYYLDHSRNIESNDGALFFWLLILLIGYLMLPQLVIEHLHRQEGKPPVIKGFIKASVSGTTANRNSYSAMIFIVLCWTGFFLLRIIKELSF